MQRPLLSSFKYIWGLLLFRKGYFSHPYVWAFLVGLKSRRVVGERKR